MDRAWEILDSFPLILRLVVIQQTTETVLSRARSIGMNHVKYQDSSCDSIYAERIKLRIKIRAISEDWIYCSLWRLYKFHLESSVLQDQDQDSLLVKRRNDNHSPGPVIRELVPSSHQRGELSNTILCIFSG